MQEPTINEQLNILLNNPLVLVQGVYAGEMYSVTRQDEHGLLTIHTADGKPAFDQVAPTLLDPLFFGFPGVSDHVEPVAAYQFESDTVRWDLFCRFMNYTDNNVSQLLGRPVTLASLEVADYRALLCSMINL